MTGKISCRNDLLNGKLCFCYESFLPDKAVGGRDEIDRDKPVMINFNLKLK
jgi:hypothetical protein